MDISHVTDEKEQDSVNEQYPNRFKPGQSGNPAGRPKKTKEEEVMLSQLKALTPLALEKMEKMLKNDHVAALAKVRIIEIILERTFGKVESAFLKDTTDVYDISFQTEKSIKVKIEVDTVPPLKFATEQKYLLQPKSFLTRCVALPDLFAGKMHALVFRTWQRRVKGRDWYDFEWYVRNGITLDWSHLHERILQFNGQDMTLEEFKSVLRGHLGNTDISRVKEDVLPFLGDPGELDIWSNDYFLQLADMMKIQG